MADFADKSTNKKKRKTRASEDKQQGPPKTRRADHSQQQEREEPKDEAKRESNVNFLEEGGPWRNLQLIQSIRNKELDIERKVQLAYDFIKSTNEVSGDTDQGCEAVSISRVTVFLNDWVQSLLISLEKKNRVGWERPVSEVIGTCLDFRCWEIFRFCLEESLKLHISLNFSRNLLRAISGVSRNAFSLLNDTSMHSKESFFVGEGFEPYGVVLDCVSLVFTSHGGVLNETLDLWISTVDAVLELVRKVYKDKLDSDSAVVFVTRFSCLVLQPFSKFLRVHPCRKSGFRDFIDKLLEPLLQVLGMLHVHIDGTNLEWSRNLLKFAEAVISQGLFHPVHIDGFLSLRSTEKYVASLDGKSKDSKAIIKSYHRHLFDRLEKIMASNNLSVLGGFGELFQLLVHRVKKHKGISMYSEGTTMIEETGDSRHLEVDFTGYVSKMSSENISLLSGKSSSSSSLRTEIHKSLFDFFVQIMEPLLVKINSYYQATLELGPMLLDIHCTLKSANKILSIFMHEKVYVRTEDTSDGGCLNFLRKAYDTITSFPIKMIQLLLPTYDTNKRTYAEMLNLIAKELIVAVGYFLEIEYEVLGNDLVNLWLMVFSFLVLGRHMEDAHDQCSFNSKLLDLGCQLINLYSDLRQVNNIIFALCKAVRIFVSRNKDGEVNISEPLSNATFLSCEAYARSVGNLICSQEFRLVIYNAVKSIPEGQASGCILQLAMDISESLEWMKACSSEVAENELKGVELKSCGMSLLNLQSEVLGRCLSEIYTLVLDSLAITTGNSTLVGNSMDDLMTVMRPSMVSLVGMHPNNIGEFLFSVIGTSNNKVDGGNNDLLKSKGSTHWVFLFFFRLYMSYRSLYQQSISLLPPNSSKKMSASMGDLITAYSGSDWMESGNWKDGGYFSWIVKPSASILVIIQSVSDIYVQDNVADCSPLIYILHAMALQRLVDLNRQIDSFEYLLQRNKNPVQIKVVDEDGLSSNHKKSGKWERRISVLRQEAEGLTEFITRFLSLVAKKQQSVYSSDDATVRDVPSQAHNENDAWDLGVCAVDENSLPIAVWWILCQNTDIWCSHAAKKKLKKFLSILIRSSLPCIEEINHINKANFLRVTVQQISSELLSDTILYEQRFVRRYLASVLCRILQDSVLSLSCKDLDFSVLPNWSEDISALDKSSVIVLGNTNVTHDCSSVAQQNSHFSNKAHPLTSTEIRACHSILNLLCWMPKEYFNFRSFSRIASFILNLERLVLGNLLNCHAAFSPQNHYELFRLFVSCRRALKCLIMTSCVERVEASKSSLVSKLFHGSSVILWLLKSVSSVVGLQHAFSEDSVSQHKYLIFSLMDHTSYTCLTLSKDQFRVAVHSLFTIKKPCDETGFYHEQKNLIDDDPCLDASKVIDIWKSVTLVAETLKEQTESLFISLKDAFHNGKTEFGVGAVNVNKLSSFVACLQGFLWGLTSAVNNIDANTCDLKPKLSKWRCEPISNLNLCINVFAKFINFLVCVLSFKDDQWPESICDAQVLPQSNNADSAASMTEVDLLELQCLDKPMLQSLLNGNNPETAFLLRQLFIASSAILRLNLQINRTPFQPTLMPTFIAISRVLLLELSNGVEVPPPLSIVCLDGVLKYLEEVGNQFPLTNPTLTRNLYAKLIDLHLRAIGKCISLQGKRATLASHDRESSTKTLDGIQGSSETSLSHSPYCLDELKSRLRLSFKVFISKPSELHLLSAIQALERALVGAREGCTTIYEVSMGNADGGKVSSIVAAGIDCLDLVLEFVSGRKRLSVVKRHIQSLIAGLYNIILHLQSPLIFYEKFIHNKGDSDPDPGSVILMCIEVLTRVSGKHALFQMDSCHVGQSLRVPAALFQDFHRLKLSEAPAPFVSLITDIQDYDPLVSTHSFVIDRRFSVDLFAACCRLLYTVLKHHQSECEQCIALLEVSVSVLLQCLETVDADSLVRKGYFAWEIQEGVKCASVLRRIYEEIRHQKDVFGQYCFQFLSNYIWIYSGYGPLKTGIRREIDEALRPGVYALIDACSADDLQHLHTVLGEGPCRSTLAALQHDYKLNFQYEGKV